MHAEEDAAEGSVEHGGPEAGEVADDACADGAELGCDGQGGVVRLAEVAVDAVELVGDEVEGDGIRCVGGEGEVLALLVVEADGLEAGASEGGVAGGVGWEGRLEGDHVCVCFWGAEGKPEGVGHGATVLADAGEGAPEFEAVFFLPSEDAGVSEGDVEDGEETGEVGVGLVAGCVGRFAIPGDFAEDLVEEARRRAH